MKEVNVKAVRLYAEESDNRARELVLEILGKLKLDESYVIYDDSMVASETGTLLSLDVYIFPKNVEGLEEVLNTKNNPLFIVPLNEEYTVEDCISDFDCNSIEEYRQKGYSTVWAELVDGIGEF